MSKTTHWVALRLGDSVLVRNATLPTLTGDSPELTAITGVVEAPSAVAIAPAQHTDVGQVHVLRLPAGSPEPDGDRCALHRLTPLRVPREVTDAITSAVAEHDGARPVHRLRAPWYRPEWAEQALTWADEALAGHGRQRAGAPVTLKVWSLSAVWQLPCVDSAGRRCDAYLKAPCALFGDEPAITATIARLAPADAPRVIAHDCERGFLLMEPLPVADPVQSPTPVQTARSMLALQRRTMEAHDDLVAAGCPERDMHSTLEAFVQVLHTSAGLELLSDQERAALPGLVEPLRDHLEHLTACGFPAVLAHGDLHLGNVAANAEELVIFDWPDACLTHPLLDLAHLAHATERAGGDPTAVLAQASRTWREVLPSPDVETAIALAPIANWVFQAVTSEGIARSTEPAAAGDLGGTVAFLLRRLLAAFGGPSG